MSLAMNRRSILTLAVGAALAPHLAVAATARGRGWRTIFDGRTLKGWTPRGESQWRAEGGALVGEGSGGFLVSDGTYGDVEFRAQVWLDDKVNSGVFVHCTNPMTIGTNSAYEYNLWDARPDPTYGTGGIVNVAKAMNPPKTVGRWTQVEIVVRGDHHIMKLDGKTTAEGTSRTYSHGRFALQASGGAAKFRNVQVREL